MLEENAVREDDSWSATLHNDTLMQAEYMEDLRRSQPDPEKRLMLAIMQDAVAYYRRNTGKQLGKRRRIFLEVENWIKDRENDSLFSFTNICETLGIDPDYLARGLCCEPASGASVPGIRYLRLESSSRRRSRRRRPETNTISSSV
jgi:hypothetical protein